MQTRTKWCFILFLALFFWYGNHLTPYLVDDYCLCKFRGLGFIDAIISSINAAIHSYMTWGGSIFWSAIQRFFLNYQKWLFDIANATHIALFLYALYTLIERNFATNFFPIIICLTTLFLIPVPTQTLFWKIGAIAYFWPIVWGFLLLLIYDRSNGRNIRGGYILVPLLALLCGNAHGALGGMILIVTIGYQFLWKFSRRAKKIPLWSVLGSVCTLIGILIMVLSPGLKERAEASGGGIGISKLIVVKMANFGQEHQLLISLLAIAIIFLWQYENNYRNERFVKANIYALSTLAGMGALLLVPASFRTSLFFPCFSAIIFGNIFSYLFEDKMTKALLTGILIVVSFSFFVKFAWLYNDGRRVKNFVLIREKYILSEKKAGNHEIYVPTMSTWRIYRRFTRGLSDLGNSENDWENQGMARYYGVEKIIGQNIIVEPIALPKLP